MTSELDTAVLTSDGPVGLSMDLAPRDRPIRVWLPDDQRYAIVGWSESFRDWVEPTDSKDTPACWFDDGDLRVPPKGY